MNLMKKIHLFFFVLLAMMSFGATASGVLTVPITSPGEESATCNHLRHAASQKMWDELDPLAKTAMGNTGRTVFGSVGMCKCIFENSSNSRKSQGTCSVKYDGSSTIVERYYYISSRTGATCEYFDTLFKNEFKDGILSALEKSRNYEPEIEQSLCERLNSETSFASYRWNPKSK